MSGSQIDHVVWGDFWAGDENGIYRYWRSLKSADPPQYLGPPISDEIAVDGGVQRAFASGAVVQWSAEGGAELANDPL